MKQKEKLALFDKIEKALKEGFYFFNEREGVINHWRPRTACLKYIPELGFCFVRVTGFKCDIGERLEPQLAIVPLSSRWTLDEKEML